MDGSTIVAIVAAAIAAASALFAMLQAQHAKDQAKAAEDQVAIMRQQLDADEADRNKRDAPVIEWKVLDGHAGAMCQFLAIVTSSPGPITLTVTGIVVRAPDEELPSTLPSARKAHSALTGSRIEIPIDLRADKDTADLRVDLEVVCTEQNEPKRSWTLAQSVQVPGAFDIEKEIF